MNEWTREEWEQVKNAPSLSLLYIYTPMCGTCQVASKMMQVINEVVTYPIGQANINYLENLAMEYEIESVPCLLISKNGIVIKKIYAFQSVPYLLDVIKSIDGTVLT
ncbi:thioredoxin family protein [Psychrobacillus vulpis]|uniref:Thioredoxin family protein n=1 Tax=Psychrobacillus vulpis TaxID=2325572 RepID=A0A544TIT4_9BACI|nr:thioredoxin family protein [Psychrobacillus vulpis]TQR17357.1 thioredoxin family protein [Psychrobacillus vulpis]